MTQIWKHIGYWIAVLGLSLSGITYAGGVSPYLPEKLSPTLENEVQRLAVVAGIPNLTRPYSVATVFHYMDKIKLSHSALYSRLNLALKPYVKKFGLTQASISVSYSEDDQPLANQRGNNVDALGHLSFRGQWQVTDWMAIYAGAYMTDYAGEGVPRQARQADGSMLSLGVDWAQLDIGYKTMWLSPFQGTAHLLSTNAQTMPSISLSNNLPIEFLGITWNYQGFLAEMSNQPVLFNDEYTLGDNPLLAGMHITVQPSDWWSIGATRVFQFAGGERPKDAETLLRAILDPRGTDNDASVDEESGNQIAALSSRIHFDGSVPFSFAVEIAGEDTSNNKDYQLGNTAVTTGLYFPYFFSDSLSLSAEYSDWQNGWYVNNVYAEGFTNEGYIAGNWAMQVQHENGTAVEGRSYYLNLHWQTPKDRIVIATFRNSEHRHTPEIDYQSGWEIELDYKIPVGGHVASIGVHTGRDNFGEEFNRFNLAWEW